jgi:DNA polymerase III alpha subunit (gram-positive type)
MEKKKIDLKDRPVVTNGNDATLLDSSYFVFDMETTGLNPKYLAYVLERIGSADASELMPWSDSLPDDLKAS